MSDWEREREREREREGGGGDTEGRLVPAAEVFLDIQGRLGLGQRCMHATIALLYFPTPHCLPG